MSVKLLNTLCALLCAALAVFSEAFALEPHRGTAVSIVVIAGQSNAINIHADASKLPAATVDSSVLFFHYCGMPPERNVPLFSSSAGRWEHLGPQRQVPYQSRFERYFGPEMGAALSLKHALPNLAIFKCAFGGSNLARDWKRGAVSGNRLYQIMLDQLRIACRALDSAGTPYVFAGFIWVQGESDAANRTDAAAYTANLAGLINGIRADLNTSALPVILSRLPAKQPYAYLSEIRRAQELTASTIPGVQCVDTDGLELDTDNVHFLAEGILTAGRRLGAALATATHIAVDDQAPFPPALYALGRNYPNPFNPATSIPFTLPAACTISLNVYDVIGRTVARLAEGSYQAGTYTATFNAKDLNSGVYFYTLRTSTGFTISNTMVLTK